MFKRGSFSAKNRLHIYETALAALRGETQIDHQFGIEWQKYHSGVCELITVSTRYILNVYASNDKIIRHFPEFRLFRPKSINYVFWWPEEDRESRENCLLFCIEMVKDKIKK